MSEANEVKAEMERLVEVIENEYGFTCPGGDLETCSEFISLKELIDDMPDTIG